MPQSEYTVDNICTTVIMKSSNNMYERFLKNKKVDNSTCQLCLSQSLFPISHSNNKLGSLHSLEEEKLASWNKKKKKKLN